MVNDLTAMLRLISRVLCLIGGDRLPFCRFHTVDIRNFEYKSCLDLNFEQFVEDRFFILFSPQS
jgi:hypothetical protein